MAATGKWAAFPYPAKPFQRDAAALARDWALLHAGDCEPFPDRALLQKRLKSAGPVATDADAAARALQEAWRAFHAGDFRAAFDAGVALGPLGASVAVKAGGIHATHLLADEKARLARYQALVELGEAAVAALPDDPNSHYRRAYALGRYSQGISVAKALQQGLAGKVRDSLERTLKLAPKHAEAHSAMGLYHCEIIGKVGAMIGGLTYGAKAATGEKHLEKALELTPESPIAHIEYGNGLMLLYGDKREDDAAAAYERAAKLTPRDAMEKLDAEYARAQLED
jgi:tetratricopeptide (TPR) repeat protein